MNWSVSSRIAALARVGTSLSAIAAASAIMVPTTAFAQTAQSTLRGRAPAGTEVVAKSLDIGTVRTTKAAADGTYVITGLQPGNYHVTAGSQSADVVLTVASTSIENFDAPRATQNDAAAPARSS